MLQIQEKILPIFLTALTTGPLYGRSIYRPKDATVPEIKTRWTDETRSYTLRHNSLEAGPIFSQFDPDYFDAHLFPDGPVTFRNHPDQSVPGSVLKNYLEILIQEIAVQKKRQQQYRHFTVIKQRDYNPRKHAGLMILKCKEYPFVIKLFMETPESFVEPFSKGLEPICFFMMGGGVNRYLAGFSRVKNALAIEKIIQNDPLLRGVLSVPRKWFWKPQQCRWFEVTGKNFGTDDYRTTLPATYAIICDAIDAEQSFHLTNKNKWMKPKCLE